MKFVLTAVSGVAFIAVVGGGIAIKKYADKDDQLYYQAAFNSYTDVIKENLHTIVYEGPSPVGRFLMLKSVQEVMKTAYSISQLPLPEDIVPLAKVVIAMEKIETSALPKVPLDETSRGNLQLARQMLAGELDKMPGYERAVLLVSLRRNSPAL